MIKIQVANSTTNIQDIFKLNCPHIQNRITETVGTKLKGWYTIGKPV